MNILLTYTKNKNRYSLVELKSGLYAFRQGKKIFATYEKKLFRFDQISDFFTNDVDFIEDNNVDLNLMFSFCND